MARYTNYDTALAINHAAGRRLLDPASATRQSIQEAFRKAPGTHEDAFERLMLTTLLGLSPDAPKSNETLVREAIQRFGQRFAYRTEPESTQTPLQLD